MWALATVAAGALITWLVVPLLAVVSAPPPPTRFDAWLTSGCAAVAVLVVAWLWVLVTVVTVEAARGPAGADLPRSGVPVLVQRLVLAACGAGLVGGLATPAYAGGERPPSPLAGLALPDRPTDAPPAGARADAPDPDRPAPASAPAPGAAEVRVAPGDSLWDLAAAELPPGADDAEIERRWRAIHAANRDVVGHDPDLILPGQRLTLPPADPSTDPGRPAG